MFIIVLTRYPTARGEQPGSRAYCYLDPENASCQPVKLEVRISGSVELGVLETRIPHEKSTKTSVVERRVEALTRGSGTLCIGRPCLCHITLVDTDCDALPESTRCLLQVLTIASAHSDPIRDPSVSCDDSARGTGYSSPCVLFFPSGACFAVLQRAVSFRCFKTTGSSG